MTNFQKSSEIVVASNGQIAVAPYGTALPAEVDTTLNAAFLDIGYVTADGVVFTATPTVEDITSWQSPEPTRRIVNARSLTVAFSLQQWNQETFALAFGGGTWSMVTPGSYKYEPPSSTAALPEYSLVIDAQDGDKALRWVVRRANINSAVTSTLQRTGAALLPVTFDALAPDASGSASWYFASDAPEFSIAS